MAPSPPGRWLGELVARLDNAGCEPAAVQLADALWLARQMAAAADGDRATGDRAAAGAPVARGDAGERDPEAAAHRAAPPRSRADHGRHPTERTEPAEPAEPADRESGSTPDTTAVSLFAGRPPGTGPGPAFPVRAPAAASLPGLLDLQRALRPLRHHHPFGLPPGPGHRELDEEETAERSARSGFLRPTFRPVRRWESDIQLLLDVSPSMVVWERMFEELRQVCERLGAFRDVQVHYLHRADNGTPLIGSAAPGGANRLWLRPADRLREPAGRRLTLLVSDCVGPLWREGQAQRLLCRLAGRAPVAVVQPLPPRLWHRTALPAVPGLLLREPAAGDPLGFLPDGHGPGRRPPDNALPVPVLLPTAPALGAWASLLSTGNRSSTRGAAAWVRPDHPPVPPPNARTPTAHGAEELLRAFQASASPGARKLAAYLSAAPTELPVMQLVQRTLLPDTGPMELAEVLLGGLLRQLPVPVPDAPAARGQAGSGPAYDFVEGVRELLFQSLDEGAATLVLKHCSEFVEQHFGAGTRNFAALAVARLSGADTEPSGAVAEDGPEQAEAPAGSALFAEVPARVVRHFRPMLHSPVDSPADRAEELLGLWHQQRDPLLLDQALACAERALAASAAAADAAEHERGDPSPEVRARVLQGRILLERSRYASARHGQEAGRADLDRAVQVLHQALAEAPAGGAHQAPAALALAAAHYGSWSARRPDPSAAAELDHAEAILRSLHPADLTPEQRQTRHLRLGRVLLARAQQDADPRARAAEAADELRTACDLTRPDQVRDTLRARAFLDLATALHLAGDHDSETWAALARARRLAIGDNALSRQILLDRARIRAETGRPSMSDSDYARAADLAPRNSLQRCEILTEWAERLLERATVDDGATTLTRAEGVLREALAEAPGTGRTLARAQLLLGNALVTRFRSAGFRPDLYEGCHLLEQAAHTSADPGESSRAWLLLGDACRLLPDTGPQRRRAARAYRLALEQARLAQGEQTGSVTAARALHGRGVIRERENRIGTALDDYRAAAAEWQRAAAWTTDVPWNEVRETRKRITALEAAGDSAE